MRFSLRRFISAPGLMMSFLLCFATAQSTRANPPTPEIAPPPRQLSHAVVETQIRNLEKLRYGVQEQIALQENHIKELARPTAKTATAEELRKSSEDTARLHAESKRAVEKLESEIMALKKPIAEKKPTTAEEAAQIVRTKQQIEKSEIALLSKQNACEKYRLESENLNRMLANRAADELNLELHRRRLRPQRELLSQIDNKLDELRAKLKRISEDSK